MAKQAIRARMLSITSELEPVPRVSMRVTIAILILLLLVLQLRLWVGDSSVGEVWRLQTAVEKQQQENRRLKERNQALEAEVNDLKQGVDAIEERARSELGMIKKDETFYQVIE